MRAVSLRSALRFTPRRPAFYRTAPCDKELYWQYSNIYMCRNKEGAMYGALQWRGLSRNNGFLWQERFVVQFPVAKVLFCLSATGFSFERVSFLWQTHSFVQFPVVKVLFCLSATGFSFDRVSFLWQR